MTRYGWGGGVFARFCMKSGWSTLNSKSEALLRLEDVPFSRSMLLP